jgi:hypothetical protein
MKPELIYTETDAERDRKTCIALDQKVTGANRELAQWLHLILASPRRKCRGAFSRA